MFIVNSTFINANSLHKKRQIFKIHYKKTTTDIFNILISMLFYGIIIEY